MAATARAKAMWRSPALGEPRELDLGRGTLLRYHEAGSGAPLVLVHGALINANLWRKLVPLLERDFRCVALELPLGSHVVPMPPTADLSPPALADLIADAIEALGIEDATLVGNDTGGALCQLVVTRRPKRIARLVLTSCDAFDNFPPKPMQPLLPVLGRSAVLRPLLAPMRFEGVRRRVMNLFFNYPIEPEPTDAYALPAVLSPGVRRDLAGVLGGLDPRYTLEAAERLRAFDKPVLIAWSRDDKFFPPRHAEELAKLLPDALLEWIDDSSTFSPEDQPERLAELVAGFVREPAPAASAAQPH
jgi:pimeloyl-ACP methyl ester carboxylesterase